MGARSSVCMGALVAALGGCGGMGRSAVPASHGGGQSASKVGAASSTSEPTFGQIQGPISHPTGSVDPAGTELLRTLAETRGFRLGLPTQVQLTPDGKAALFLRGQARLARQTLFELDLASGKVREILTPDQLLGAGGETLTPEERARRERLRIRATGFAGFEVSGDGERVLVSLAGRLFVLERTSGAVRELKAAGDGVYDAHWSPDGRQVAYVRQHDLHVVAVEGGAERAVTTGGTPEVSHGEAEFIAQEELDRTRGYFWSPDGTTLLFEEADNRSVERLTIADPAHPEREPDRPFYPRPGRANARVRFGLASLAAKGPRTPLWVHWDDAQFPYVATVKWQKGAPPTLLVMDRLQKRAQLLAIEVATGKTKVLVEEKDDAWINVEATVPYFCKGGSAFLWSSDRDGSSRLELRKSSGELVRSLSPEGLDYRAVLHVDEGRQEVYFLAGENPTVSAVYRVRLAGGPAEVVAGGADDMVSASFGKSDDVFVVYDGQGQGQGQPKVRVKQTHGPRSWELPSVAEPPPFVPRVEHRRVGKDQVHVALVRPRTFVAGRKVPVIDAAYGGPTTTVVSSNALSYLRSQWLADATGAIVVAMDTKGTPHRGRAWERAVAGKLGSVPVNGHAETLRDLAQELPEMDPARIGVFGWSFGGYFSAYGVLSRPDVYKVGVAGAPPVDWRDYDTAYTERYLGLPRDSQKAYDDASVLSLLTSKSETGAPGSSGTAAGIPRGPLLVIHGTADDNVFFFNSLKLVDALERAGRTFEFLPLAGMTHMVVEPDMSLQVWERTAEFFRKYL